MADLIRETVTEKNGVLEAVYEVKMSSGETLRAVQPLTARDENLQAVAKKRATVDLKHQMGALTWADAVAWPEPAPRPRVQTETVAPDAKPEKKEKPSFFER